MGQYERNRQLLTIYYVMIMAKVVIELLTQFISLIKVERD